MGAARGRRRGVALPRPLPSHIPLRRRSRRGGARKPLGGCPVGSAAWAHTLTGLRPEGPPAGMQRGALYESVLRRILGQGPWQATEGVV